MEIEKHQIGKLNKVNSHACEPEQEGLWKRHLLVLIILLVACMVFGWLFCNLPFFKKIYESEEYPMWTYVADMVSVKQPEVSVLMIGDSRAKAGFIPSQKNMLNLALGGSTPVEGFYTLKKLLQSGSRPEHLVMSYTPLHLMRQEVFWQRTVNYKFLKHDEYKAVREAAKDIYHEQAYQYGPLGEEDKWWQYRMLPGMHLPTLFANWLRGVEEYDTVYSSLVISRGHYFFGKDSTSSDTNLESELKNFQVNRLLIEYLNKTIDLAQQYEIKVHWYTMPFNQASCDKMQPKFKTNFLKSLKSFEDKNVNIIQEFDCWDNSLFGDADHLFKGAEQASQSIINAIVE